MIRSFSLRFNVSMPRLPQTQHHEKRSKWRCAADLFRFIFGLLERSAFWFLSVGDVSANVESLCDVQAIFRRRRLRFAGAPARLHGGRLPKRLIFAKLVVEARTQAEAVRRNTWRKQSLERDVSELLAPRRTFRIGTAVNNGREGE